MSVQFLRDLSRYSDEVRNCTRSLEHLGITCFYYAHINAKGDFTMFTDAPLIIDEHYVGEDAYLHDPYLEHPTSFQTGFFSFHQFQRPEHEAMMQYLASKFNMIPLIGYCKRDEDDVEFFGFWRASKANIPIPQIIFNYPHILQDFAAHFKTSCKKILQSDTRPYLPIGKIKEQAFARSIMRENTDPETIHQFLKEIGLQDEVKKVVSLSSREKECVQLLLQGMSAKESGSILNVSPRTIEYYLNNVKDKFRCKFKNEIFSQATRLNHLGLLNCENIART